MTREDAINILYGMKADNLNLDDLYTKDKYEALDMAITALSQEPQSEWERDHEVLKAYTDGQESMKPCSDVISRQAVDKLIDELARKISDERCFTSRGRSTATIMQDILDLPSVSTEKVGKWKHFAWSDDCSECGWSTGKYGSPTKYCPNCGAKMEEVGESE